MPVFPRVMEGCCVATPCRRLLKPELAHVVGEPMLKPETCPVLPENSLAGSAPLDAVEVPLTAQPLAVTYAWDGLRPVLPSWVEPKGTPDTPAGICPVTSVPPKGRITGLSPGVWSSVLPSGTPDGVLDVWPHAAFQDISIAVQVVHRVFIAFPC